ncbi:GGDEF domain-containing protein [Alteromonas gilva]|uniref:diguanylate cyclase n=1 Tax=Alteromonas gilva TaxID=2987522 RepID=A0ABT5KYE8_9ALTE|nr:GGDEF domain-containing protein [Alteromonas gilva]MDC8829795.1 GGDEF domain-containing protein [Alteromonas gilva]
MSEVKQAPGKISVVEWLLAVLACISVGLLLIPSDLISRNKMLYAKDYPAHLYTDASQGGQSEASWVDQSNLKWQCRLEDKTLSPYCSMQLDVAGFSGQGLDLSDFEKMTVWLNYSGNAEFVRIYLRNRNPNYYRPEDITSTKYNVVEVPVVELASGLTIEMDTIFVADWWLSSRKIPLKYAHPEFNDIIYIEIQTGSQVRDGTHQLQLDRIEWSGAWISQADLYKLIIVVWIVCIFAILLYRIVRLNIQLKHNQRYQSELQSINELLNFKNKKFEDLANTDQLTGLLNRLGIREALYQGQHKWKSERQPFSFILIDIDHFKKLNDTFGHDAGDSVLQAVAETLSGNIRRTDFLARWGGEEFLLVCPNTTLKEAEVVAEQLRQKVAAMEHPEVEPITASFGVSSMTEPDLKLLFKNADNALYQAKSAGRNKVVCNI